MKFVTHVSVGPLLCAMSAIICAIPTLLLPADSPNAPKTALLAVGAVVFAAGVIRVRRETLSRREASAERDDENGS
ncbi:MULTISPECIES: hypothetical protein [Microbacterium]|uniref:hypothetical protein n=1 Tax=Microbacterium TaxID=33882 RepID=UPI00278289BB|nr:MULTISPECIES: hypothetical protein [Microbacterium]MDQ1082993.1 hypothetical protein [Microbacterium sp. SORGH_AS_0344]MDQ1168240.1 hypothetical protein [Microbacterium proteolyticum]